MSSTNMKKPDAKQIEALIKAAVKKIGANKENDICRYIPSNAGGYIHHFTMRKMKGEDPATLATMVNKYIIDVEKPSKVQPKKRAARGSRKRRDLPQFTKQALERMLNMARMANDHEMVRMLTPKKDLKSIKRELQASIRRNEVDQELWNLYCEVANSQSSLNFS